MTIRDAFDDLDEYMTGEEDLPERLEDDLTAERMMRALCHHIRQADKYQAIYDAEVARLDEWRTRVQHPHRGRIEYLTDALKSYLAARRRQDPRVNRIQLPSGQITATGGAPAWEFDEDLFLSWAAVNMPELIRHRDPEINRADAKKILTVVDGKAVTAEGETVPGVTIVPQEKNLNVKPGE